MLGDGIGLSQANGIDDYEPENVLQQLREADEKNDWRRIKIEDLNKYHSSLSFFDAEGMRFHLPACMIADLREQYNRSVLHVVADTSGYGYELCRLFSSKQKRAVISYLEYQYSINECQNSRGPITRSLDDFWRQ